MAKAPSKKQNNRADPLSKKDGKKDGKEAQSSKDPKQSHLCKCSLPRNVFSHPISGLRFPKLGESMCIHQATSSRHCCLNVQKVTNP